MEPINQMTEKPSLKAAMAAERMVGFWFGIRGHFSCQNGVQSGVLY